MFVDKKALLGQIKKKIQKDHSIIPDLWDCTSVWKELFCALVTAFSRDRFGSTK